MLPTPYATWTPTQRPRWRDWAHDVPQEINYPEVIAGTAEVVSRLMTDAGTDGDRWADLVAHLDSLPNDQERILARLEAIDPADLGESRTKAWRALVELANKHRDFADAPWVMPTEVIERAERAAARFAPDSSIELHRDLFSHRARLPGVDRADYEAYNTAVQTARAGAVREVLDRDGVSGVLALGQAVELPAAVGSAAGEARGDELADDLLPLLGSLGTDDRVASGYAGARIEADGLDWLERQLVLRAETASVPQLVGLLLAVMRPSSRLLAIIENLSPDVQAEYWRRMNPVHADDDAAAAVVREPPLRLDPWARPGQQSNPSRTPCTRRRTARREPPGRST